MKFVCFLIILLFSTLPTPSFAVELHPADENTGTGVENVKIVGNRKMYVDGVMKIERKEITESVIDKRGIMRMMHEKCKKAGNHCEEKSDDGGFVAFNADYHAPRHHPPKNN
ncbi:root meristem growth factor 2 [Carica papaya]|uniref:root meristem growth factor 2 n=1 Tax=Carica papaya TaxID=3649 RepID=UPI000B8C8D5C|nr:root meristem growth factor 2 [Carica papaya]